MDSQEILKRFQNLCRQIYYDSFSSNACFIFQSSPRVVRTGLIWLRRWPGVRALSLYTNMRGVVANELQLKRVTHLWFWKPRSQSQCQIRVRSRLRGMTNNYSRLHQTFWSRRSQRQETGLWRTRLFAFFCRPCHVGISCRNSRDYRRERSWTAHDVLPSSGNSFAVIWPHESSVTGVVVNCLLVGGEKICPGSIRGVLMGSTVGVILIVVPFFQDLISVGNRTGCSFSYTLMSRVEDEVWIRIRFAWLYQNFLCIVTRTKQCLELSHN